MTARRVIAVAAALAGLSGFLHGPPAGAVAPADPTSATVVPSRTVADFFQVALQMPPQLWEDGNGLPFMMGDEVDVFTEGDVTYRIAWTNAATSGSTSFIVRSLTHKYGTGTAALLDRPLPAAKVRRAKLIQRLLWQDADVLLAAAGSPMCSGLTRDQLQGVLTGTVSDWREVFPAWPSGTDPAVRLLTVAGSDGRPRWGFGTDSFARGASRTSDAGSLAVAGGQVAVQKLSFVLPRLSSSGVCLVPVDGITPSEQTTRDSTYPYAYGVYYVRRSNPMSGPSATWRVLMRRWDSLLFGEMGSAYLTTSMGRSRFLPVAG